MKALLAISLLLAVPGATLRGAEDGRDSRAVRELPDYMTGDECLFCHRIAIGPSWGRNAHQRTLRPIESDPRLAAWIRAHPDLGSHAEEIDYVLGARRSHRLLRKSGRYGQLDLLGAFLRPRDGVPRLENEPPFEWDPVTFADNCAGCHATATDSRTRAFAAVGIDCYSCHGVVDLQHANDGSLVLLSPGRPAPPELVASTCGQCHIRSGRSRRSGLPYPDNHVAGDDLFADFVADLSPAALEAAPPRERHVLESIREMRAGRGEHSCLACHSIHREDGRRHRALPESRYCRICHGETDLEYDRNTAHHPLCRY